MQAMAHLPPPPDHHHHRSTVSCVCFDTLTIPRAVQGLTETDRQTVRHTGHRQTEKALGAPNHHMASPSDTRPSLP